MQTDFKVFDELEPTFHELYNSINWWLKPLKENFKMENF